LIVNGLASVGTVGSTYANLTVNGNANVTGSVNSSQVNTTGNITSATDFFANTNVLVPPAGSMMMFASLSIPTGWLLCDGSVISRATYSRLFDVISTTFGVGDGSTTFSLPDMRSSVPIGVGQKPSLSAYTLGQVGGVESVTLNETQIPSHTHTASLTDPGHSHTDSASQGSGYAAADGGNGNRANGGGTTSTSTTGITVSISNTGGGLSHENRQPFVGLNYIIKF